MLTFLDGVIAPPDEIEARVEAGLARSEGTAMPEVMSRLEARLLQRGQDQGRVEERLSLVPMLLERQRGPLAEEVAARIQDLTPEQLVELGLALLRFSRLADLTTWISKNAPAVG